MQSMAQMVKEYLAASKRVSKKVLRSKKAARQFLIDAGMATKDGKRLAPPYR